MSETISIPHKSKVKLKYARNNPEIRDNPPEESIPDFQMKPLKKYYRPTFSPHTNSWVVDIAFIEGSQTFGYLFFINENTRFLFCWPYN
jgi:hypothetical protein